MSPGPSAGGGPVWVFGYGSLIWRPGFAHLRRLPARLDGWHRAFCRYSFHHRGTPERPGLVIGLREGGSCVGMVYAVAPEEEAAALDYLDTREGAGYRREKVTVHPLDNGAAVNGGAPLSAWTYIPNPGHPSYFGREDHARLVELVAQGSGRSGTALDYLRDLIAHLEDMGVEEPALAAVLAEAEGK